MFFRITSLYYVCVCVQLLQLTRDLETWSTIPLPSPVTPPPPPPPPPPPTRVSSAPLTSQPLVIPSPSPCLSHHQHLAKFRQAIQQLLTLSVTPSTTHSSSLSLAVHRVTRSAITTTLEQSLYYCQFSAAKKHTKPAVLSLQSQS